MSFVSWPEIEQFHSVRRTILKYPELLGGRTTVQYRGKVKIHGTNAAVQVRGDKVIAQSRSSIITPGDDNQGFAAWVESVSADFVRACDIPYIFFGEWCGPGIQKGMAVNGLKEKIFAVFAGQSLDEAHGDLAPGALDVDPDELESALESVPRTYVIPWYGDTVDVPWLEEPSVLEGIVSGINDRVLEVEACDPWAKSTFGLEGVGEGIVYYPVSHPGRKHFSDLAFKCKGEKHKIVKKDRPAQVDPSVAKSYEDFAEMVCTPARLEQGARAAARGELVFENRLIGPFIGWISSDVHKECMAELEASGLDWKLANKAITSRARLWYLANLARM